MKPFNALNTEFSSRGKRINQSSSRQCFLSITLSLACFAFSMTARAVTPAPDGGYPNGNTAEGDNALFSLTNGSNNTANGSNALGSNTGGSSNTAVGSGALKNNITGSRRRRANAPTLGRTKNLIDAALRVWELKQRPR
jgi:hypothetical protein